jgi:hypothetical protein
MKSRYRFNTGHVSARNMPSSGVYTLYDIKSSQCLRVQLQLMTIFPIIQAKIQIYITLRYVSIQGSAVSGLQERNRTY